MTREEQIKLEADELTKSNHQQWLELPTTQIMIQKLRDHCQIKIQALCASATNKDVSDASIRWAVVSMKTLIELTNTLATPPQSK